MSDEKYFITYLYQTRSFFPPKRRPMESPQKPLRLKSHGSKYSPATQKASMSVHRKNFGIFSDRWSTLNLLLFLLPALPQRYSTPVALSDTYLRCRSGLIRIRVAVQSTCETSRFCLLLLLFFSSTPRARLSPRDTIRGLTAYGEMRDAPPLPVTTTVFSFFSLPVSAPHFTRHRAVRALRDHTGGDARSSLPSLVHGEMARMHRTQPRTYEVNVHACTQSTRPSVRLSVCPPALPFVPPSVRPSTRLASERRIGAARVYRRRARLTESRSRTRAATLRHMFQRATSIIGTHARTFSTRKNARVPSSTRE